MNIPKVEWSGVLFYEVKGSIKNPKKMRIICRDILLMDKGNKVYTEYSFDESVTDYMMENPELMTLKMGHIHSHNDMPTFFSGTDMDELHDNSPNHNFYLSLIVNNWNEPKAKISFIGKSAKKEVSIPVEAQDENGDKYRIDNVKYELQKEYLYVYDCDILMKGRRIVVDKSKEERLKEIFKQSEIRDKAKIAATTKPVTQFGYTGTAPNPSNAFKEKLPSKDFIQETVALVDVFNDGKIDVIESFCCHILRLGTSMPGDTLETVLEDAETVENHEAFIESVTTNFEAYYDKFFQDYFKNNYNEDYDKENINKYLENLEYITSTLTDYEEEFPFLTKIIDYVRTIGNIIESNLKASI